jgi:hypothetical protein
VKLAVLGVVAMALVYGIYQVVGRATDEPPTDHVLVLDGSASFATEVDSCPALLAPVAERAARRFDRLLIASFARDALGRPWSYEVDYQVEYDKAHDEGDVEFATRDEWAEDQAEIATAELVQAADRTTEYGSALLEQLERIAVEMKDRDDRMLAIAVCTDGEIVDEKVDVRKRFDQAQAIELWLPRLDGLQGATVRFIGFGRGLKPDENRRSREFLNTLLDDAGVVDVDFGPGAET